MGNHFDVFLHLVCKYFIEYFCLNGQEGNCSVILFDGPLRVSVPVAMWSSKMDWAVFPLFQVCGKNLRNNDIFL